MICFTMTDKGIVRKENQDVGYVNGALAPDTALALVCDGMGGARSGQVASQLAADVFVETVTRLVPEGGEAFDPIAVLRSAADAANGAVFEKSQSDARYYGMGTTLVAAILKGRDCWVLNVGDSRAYAVSRGKIQRVTRDHSVVAELVARGDITEAESIHHPNRNLITRALGTEETVRADTFYLSAAEGDFLLLCSDGLSNVISQEEMVSELCAEGSVEAHCGSLIRTALLRGAPDNITVALCRR